jgi:hypothetical protein
MTEVSGTLQAAAHSAAVAATVMSAAEADAYSRGEAAEPCSLIAPASPAAKRHVRRASAQ